MRLLRLFLRRVRIVEWIGDPRLAGQNLAGQRFVDVRRIHQHAREHDRRLSQILRTQMIKGVEVAVMDPGLVVQGILNELKRRQPEPAQEHMVRRVRGFGNYRGSAEASKR